MEAIALGDIRSNIISNIGREVTIKPQRSRKKEPTVTGVIENAYKSVFTVTLQDEYADRRVSYTYSDVFTHAVELKF